MVKKIQLVDTPPSSDELSDAEYRQKMLAFMEAIDWKLWELLKIQQSNQDTVQETPVTPKKDEIEVSEETEQTGLSYTKVRVKGK